MLAVVPIIISSAYSCFCVDDFSNANTIGVFGENIVKLFIASLRFTKRKYLNWQGAYTSLFLQSFLSPLNGLGDMQLRFIMVLNVVLFVISLKLFIGSVCKSMNINDAARWGWISFSLCIIGILGFTSWKEIFHWFTGAVNYSFPMSFGLLGITCMLLTKNKWYCVLGSGFMFLASGGALEIAGIGCFVLLGICILKRMTDNINIKDYVVFGVAVAGALINAAAPGNYVRHGVTDDTGIHLVSALMVSVLEVCNTFEDLIVNTPFVLIVLIVLIAVFIGAEIGRNKKENKTKELLIIVLFCILVPVVTRFPVELGYSGAGMPKGCKFIEVVVIVVSSVFVAGIIGYAKKKLINLRSSYTRMLLMLILIIMGNINPSWIISNSIPFQMWEEIRQDSYKTYYNEIRIIYNNIASDRNDDVFIYDLPEPIDTFQAVDISEDMSYWGNEEVAEYFGKKSIQVVSGLIARQSDGQRNIRISSNTFDANEGYVSAFKIDSVSQNVETLYLLEPLDSNRIISIPEGEEGKIAIYLFADSEGTIPLDAVEADF